MTNPKKIWDTRTKFVKMHQREGETSTIYKLATDKLENIPILQNN